MIGGYCASPRSSSRGNGDAHAAAIRARWQFLNAGIVGRRTWAAPLKFKLRGEAKLSCPGVHRAGRLYLAKASVRRGMDANSHISWRGSSL